jgi:hypothetical protein
MVFQACGCYQLVVPSRCFRMLPGIESEQSGSSFADTGGHQIIQRQKQAYDR